MGWFKEISAAPGEKWRPSAVSVRRTADGKTAGAAVVLGTDTVLTCAHVVNDALGRAQFDPRPPGLDELFVEVNVEVKGARKTERYPARVAHWIPPRTRDGQAVRDGDLEWLGDLAVLRIDAPPRGVPAPDRCMGMVPGRRVRAWHGSGYSATFADLEVAALDDGIGYLDGKSTGMAVDHGYSGGPLWSEEDGAVVGLVAAHFMPSCDAPPGPQHMIRRSWGIPWQRVETELRNLGVAPADEDTEAGQSYDPGDPPFVKLVETIRYALPTSSYSFGDTARKLAVECGREPGSAVAPPSVEEFAAFLVSHPQAVAALTQILRPTNPAAADRVLAAGQFFESALLLSPREHQQLHQLLRKVDRPVLGRLPEVVREAAKRVDVRSDGDTPDAQLLSLERLAGDGHSDGGGPRVPALLRVVEYVAVLCPAPQKGVLRLWSDSVAVRLGIPAAALRERRSDAEDWARMVRARTGRVRVLVQVTQAARGRHRLRIWCDEGSGPRQVSADSSAAYSASEAARELLRVLESLTPSAADGGRPLVEVLVDSDNLNLPVDEWAAQAPGEIIPGMLGAEFPLVVHCPELLRRHERFLPDWRERWRQLDSGQTLVVSDPGQDPHQVYYELMGRLDTVRVSVDVPPGPRDRIVQICLAVGIPVVVWDRGQDTPSHAAKHMAELATRELPDGVRVYRANARGTRAPEFPGRPVLAWADADRTVPRLQLTDPQESA
ncbi:VMAP-C domain-containing protein [Streptomyces sp. SD31]|uniref:VMAP-C domain-containing protein n=1 Tax=Streptomyces sp. SD31 TaxID=3452208 RepID=UPI003F8C3075